MKKSTLQVGRPPVRLLVAAAVPLLHLYSPDASAQVASTQRVQGTPSATATPQAAAATGVAQE